MLTADCVGGDWIKGGVVGLALRVTGTHKLLNHDKV